MSIMSFSNMMNVVVLIYRQNDEYSESLHLEQHQSWKTILIVLKRLREMKCMTSRPRSGKSVDSRREIKLTMIAPKVPIIILHSVCSISSSQCVLLTHKKLSLLAFVHTRVLPLLVYNRQNASMR